MAEEENILLRLGNVGSLAKKMAELETLTSTEKVFWECSVM